MATPNKVTEDLRLDILRRWYGGTTQAEIARALKLNRNTVIYALRGIFGVETPKHWRGGGRVAVQRPLVPKERPTFEPPKNARKLRRKPPSEAQRFWAKVAAPDQNGCRVWAASYAGDTGQFCSRLEGKPRNQRAYRVAWQLTYGPIPQGKQVNHRCDVRACVEPTHLWLGTQAENLLDMAAKGRGRKGAGQGKGESNATAKLTWVRVREIRRLRDREGWTLQALATRFKISCAQASNITRRIQWQETETR